MINSPGDQINQARSLLENAKEVVIALSTQPTFDAVASALSLYLGLSSRGIQVSVICPDQMTVEFSHLVGVDKVRGNINGSAGRNLVISFPYQEGSIEKVSYNIEGNTFNLVIEPREGYPVITQEVINFSQSGGSVDLIITVGVAQLGNLDHLYNNNSELFSGKPILNIDVNNQNGRFGRVNLVDPSISSVSELMLGLFSNFGIPLNAEIATNLLAGLTSGSTNFSSVQTQASTYEAAALCLRSGARKITLPAAKPSAEESFFQPVKPVPVASPLPARQTFAKPPIGGKQPAKPKPFAPPTQPGIQPQQQQSPPPPPKKQTAEAPPDWLKPKIYKGSTLL